MFGGKVQVLRKNIIHLLRGEIYKINNKKVFVMGGLFLVIKSSELKESLGGSRKCLIKEKDRMQC